MTIGLAVLLQLATACAPLVAPETIAAIAQTESGFDPFAINDNTSGRSYFPVAAGDAVRLASVLREQGHSIDLGLMQVNSANFTALGLSLADAFDPCRSIAAGGRILRDAFTSGLTRSEAQAALRSALSRYNTGNPQRGITNGYVRRVEASALQMIPALQVMAPAAPSSADAANSSRPEPASAETEGEWHAGPIVGQAGADFDGEWHAVAPSPARLITTPTGSDASSVVLLQHQPGSKS